MCRNVIMVYVKINDMICERESGMFNCMKSGWSSFLIVDLFKIFNLMEVNVILSWYVDKYLLRCVVIFFMVIVVLFFFVISWLICEFLILIMVNLDVMKNVVRVIKIVIKIKFIMFN